MKNGTKQVSSELKEKIEEKNSSKATGTIAASSGAKEAKITLKHGKITSASIKTPVLGDILTWKLKIEYDSGSSFELSKELVDERIRTIALSIGQAVQIENPQINFEKS